MSRGTLLSDDTVREIARRVAARESIAQIKRAMPGVSDGSIRNYFARFVQANGDATKAAEELIKQRSQHASRQGSEIADETVEEIKRLRYASNMRPGDIADRLGVSITTVYKYAPPRGTPAKRDEAVAAVVDDIRSEGLKKRILRQICEFGPYDSVQRLTDDVRQPGEGIGTHEVTSIIMKGLGRNRNGEGALVKYTQHLSGGRHGRGESGPLTRIEATPAGYRAAGYPDGFTRHNGRPGDGTDFRNQPGRAPGGPIESRHDGGILNIREATLAEIVAGEPAPFPEAAAEPPTPPAPPEAPVSAAPEDFPLLLALLGRQREKAEARVRAQAYLDAAAILEAVNGVEAQRLEELASEEEGKPFTALEIEHLALGAKLGLA